MSGIDVQNIQALAAALDHNSHALLRGKVLANPQLLEVLQQDVLERMARNMACFKQYMPNIYEQFVHYTPKRAFEFVCCENGIPNLYFADTQEFFYKAENPLELCYKQMDLILEGMSFDVYSFKKIDNCCNELHFRYLNEIIDKVNNSIEAVPTLREQGSCPLCYLLGCGLGYTLGALYEKLDVANLILIEPDSDLFYASLFCFDWDNLLRFIVQENRSLSLMLGQSKETVLADLQTYFATHGAMLSKFIFSIQHYSSQQLTDITNEIVNKLDSCVGGTGFFDDCLYSISHGFSHIQKRIPFILGSSLLPSSLLERPIFIVGNGPSLNHDIELLRKLQNKVLIIACGSVLETLYRQGIKPHFYVCTERILFVINNLAFISDESFFEDVILVSTDVVHPEVAAKFKHCLLFAKANDLFFAYLCNKFPKVAQNLKMIDYINPLVGNFGVAFAKYLGFKHVYLFGLDNGSRIQSETHAKGSEYYNLKSVQKYVATSYMYKLHEYAEANFGGVVHTNNMYRLAATYMGIVCELGAKQGQEFFNCSDGIKITGVKPLHSQELEESFSKLNDMDFAAIKSFFTTSIAQPLELDLEHVLADEESRAALFEQDNFNWLCESLLKMIHDKAAPALSSRLEFAMHLQLMNELVCQVIHTQSAFIGRMLYGSITSMSTMILRGLYKTKEETKALECAYECLEFLAYFLEDAKRYYALLPKIYQGRSADEFFGGKAGFDHPNSLATNFIIED